VKEERTTLGQVEIKVEEGMQGLGDEDFFSPSFHISEDLEIVWDLDMIL